MKYQVKELDIGGILDQAISLVKNRFGLLLVINLILFIPYGIITGLIFVANQPVIPKQITAENLGAVQQQLIQMAWTMVPSILLLCFVVLPLTTAAVTYAIASEYLERPITVGGAYRRALHILPAYLGTAILFYLAVMVGWVLCVIPGILFGFWFALWGQVVVIEGTGGTAALKRSKFLMSGNYLKLFLLGLVIAVINYVIGMLAGLVPEQHVGVLVRAVLQAVLASFGTAAIVVFYISCRCKAENFDLALLAESVAAAE